MVDSIGPQFFEPFSRVLPLEATWVFLYIRDNPKHGIVRILYYIEMTTFGSLEGPQCPHAALAATAQNLLRASHPLCHSLQAKWKKWKDPPDSIRVLGDVHRGKGFIDIVRAADTFKIYTCEFVCIYVCVYVYIYICIYIYIYQRWAKTALPEEVHDRVRISQILYLWHNPTGWHGRSSSHISHPFRVYVSGSNPPNFRGQPYWPQPSKMDYWHLLTGSVFNPQIPMSSKCSAKFSPSSMDRDDGQLDPFFNCFPALRFALLVPPKK